MVIFQQRPIYFLLRNVLIYNLRLLEEGVLFFFPQNFKTLNNEGSPPTVLEGTSNLKVIDKLHVQDGVIVSLRVTQQSFLYRK